MKKTDEIRDWLLKNAVDSDGDLWLDCLDFSNFDGNVYIGNMKVKRNLNQDSQVVKGNLYQNRQDVQGNLQQSSQHVQGNLYQNFQVVKGNLYNSGNKYGGELMETPSTKLLKEITLDELKEMGYVIKEEANE